MQSNGDNGNYLSDVWLECTSIALQNLSLDVILPYTQQNIHLFQERRAFLTKHDRATSRFCLLIFETHKCYNYNSIWFFFICIRVKTYQ